MTKIQIHEPLLCAHRLKQFVFLLFCIHVAIPLPGQKRQPPFQHVEPPFWWIGMKNTSMQILFYNNEFNVSAYTASINYPGVVLKEVKKVSNPHYAFLTLEISSGAQPGIIPIQFALGKKKFTVPYELKDKDASAARIQGFDASDVIYLIMPDRFAGRTLAQNDIYGDIKKRLHWRKSEKGDSQGGKLTHYVLDDNIYMAYFRDHGEKTIMFLPSANEAEKGD